MRRLQDKGSAEIALTPQQHKSEHHPSLRRTRACMASAHVFDHLSAHSTRRRPSFPFSALLSLVVPPPPVWRQLFTIDDDDAQAVKVDPRRPVQTTNSARPAGLSPAIKPDAARAANAPPDLALATTTSTRVPMPSGQFLQFNVVAHSHRHLPLAECVSVLVSDLSLLCVCSSLRS